jgi:hypothetical protein
MAHRTQITLPDWQYERLREESRRTGSSIAELIRRSLEATYGGLSREERLRALDESFGLWRDRRDLPEDSVEYVRRLRGPGLGERLRRLGLDEGR